MLEKYKKNLAVIADKIYSYDTEVASIDFEKKEITAYRYYSQTTSKHINYVAKQFGLYLKTRLA